MSKAQIGLTACMKAYELMPRGVDPFHDLGKYFNHEIAEAAGMSEFESAEWMSFLHEYAHLDNIRSRVMASFFRKEIGDEELSEFVEQVAIMDVVFYERLGF